MAVRTERNTNGLERHLGNRTVENQESMVKTEGKWEIKDDDQVSGLVYGKASGIIIHQDREEKKKI